MKPIDLFKAEHEELRRLFRRIERTENDDARLEMFQKLRRELEDHTRTEEDFLYALLESEADFKDLIETSYDDHEELSQLLVELSREKNAADFADEFDEMSLAFEEHIKTEEEELFPMAELALSSRQLEVLSQVMLEKDEPRRAA